MFFIMDIREANMKNGKKAAIVLSIVILLGLIIFVSTKTLDDGHLRVDGIRVKVPSNTLLVEDCNSDTKNAVYCEKNIEVNGKDNKLVFEYKNFKESGYPETLVATINGQEFFKKENLNLEIMGSSEYSMFHNFKVMEDYIVFTYTNGTNGRTTTLYAIDLEGNTILEEKEIDQDDMLLKDYTTFISYEDNVITVYASKMVQDIAYQDKHICSANSKDIVEAYYTYTLKHGKFTKKQTKTITAKEFIEEKNIECSE